MTTRWQQRVVESTQMAPARNPSGQEPHCFSTPVPQKHGEPARPSAWL